jgi:hypothetical protein
MSPPRVRARRLAPTSADWFWCSARYPTAQMARSAWERGERKIAIGSLGIYRHGPRENIGTVVTAVSLKRDEIERCARLLRDGVDELLDVELLDSMILRRARVVVAETQAHGDVTGRLKIRRPESGAALDHEGVMHEREPGRG